MSLKLGSTSIGSLYLGSTKIGEAYLGSTKVYASAPAPTPYNVIGGKTYPTCTLPDGHEWLAVNLDYAWSGLSVPTSGASLSESPQAMYYDYDESTYGWNGLKHGLLYNYPAVVELESNKATLCPGWHVPTNDEINALKTALGEPSTAAAKLKSTTGWANLNGTDDYGFAGYPSGCLGIRGTFGGINTSLYLWTQTANATPGYAQSWDLSDSNNYVGQGRIGIKGQNSVRLIRDY